MTETTTAPRLVQLDDYAPVIGVQEIDDLHALARQLTGRTVQMINSTAVGGGVAEILNRLVPLMRELGVCPRWDVITGGNDFMRMNDSCV